MECMLVENGIICAVGNLGMPALPLVTRRLTVGRSEQIRKFWSGYNPNVSLKVFQTPPSSVIVPGLAGMTLRASFPVIKPAPQMLMVIFSNGELRSSYLSKAARRSMVLDRHRAQTAPRLS